MIRKLSVVDTFNKDNECKENEYKITSPLQLMPSYVEKYTTFASDKAPDLILNKLMHAFSDQGADVEFIASKNKIEGVCYGIGAKYSNFCVQMFCDTENNNIIIEFQRRYGCSVSFMGFVRAILRSIGTIITHRFSNIKKNAPLTPFLPPIPLVWPNPEPNGFDMEPDFIANLFSMAWSQYADQQIPALNLLIDASTTGINQQQLIEYKHDIHNTNTDIVMLIKHALESHVVDVRRSGALLLVNICAQKQAHARIIDVLQNIMITEKNRSTDVLIQRDIKRWITRVFDIITTKPTN